MNAGGVIISPKKLEIEDEMENNQGTQVDDTEQADLGELGEEGISPAYPHKNP